MSIVLAAANSTTFAAALNAAGVDRIIAYHSSAYRAVGLPSAAGLLPWANANEQTLQMLPDVLAGADATPVIATVCANDGVLPLADMITRVRRSGATGVLNAPTVGLYEGVLRAVLEAEGLGRDTEITLISQARDAGLEAWAYVFDPDWAHRAAQSGAAGIIVHLGITGYPSPIDAAACITAAAEGGATHVLLHGGQLRTPHALRSELDTYPPETAQFVDGYMGASVFEHADDLPAAVHAWRDALDPSRGGTSS